MDLIKLAYTGRKPFNDMRRHGSFHVWQPGDERLVSHMAARQLLKYAEFTAVVAKPANKAQATKQGDTAETSATSTPADEQQSTAQAEEEAQRAAALAAIEAQKQAAQQEHSIKEGMLLSISTWDKDQLKDYAAKYEVNINKTRGLQSIREEVAGLVEQFGVR
jgi:phenylalanyl-tRNA synthetase alpha subunit